MKEAEKELKLAISLNPNNATAHQYYSELLGVFGKHKESREELDIALSLDPHSIILQIINGWKYFNEGNYDKAIAESQKIRNLNQRLQANTWLCFNTYMVQNKYRLAVDDLKEIVKSNDLTEKYSFNIEEVYLDSGIEGILREFILSELKMPDAYTPGTLATFYAFLGEDQKALDHLENLYVTRNRQLLNIKNSFYFKDLRSEPRFQAILKKMDLE